MCHILFPTFTLSGPRWRLFESGERFQKPNWVPPGWFPHLIYQFFRGQSCKIFFHFPWGKQFFVVVVAFSPENSDCKFRSWPMPKGQNTFTWTSRQFCGTTHFTGGSLSRATPMTDKTHILFASHSPSLNSQPFFQDSKVQNCVAQWQHLMYMWRQWKKHLNVSVLKYEDNMFPAKFAKSWFPHPLWEEGH